MFKGLNEGIKNITNEHILMKPYYKLPGRFRDILDNRRHMGLSKDLEMDLCPEDNFQMLPLGFLKFT